MDTVLHIISSLLLFVGAFLCISGGLGLLRFPDFFSRMHAVGVTETLATTMIIVGLLLQDSSLMVDIKLVIILLMTLFISPTASHALANAAMHSERAQQNDKKSSGEVTSSKP